MINVNHSTNVKTVATIRDKIDPIEDIAAKWGVQFDTVIKAGIPQQRDRLAMSATLTEGRMTFETTPEETTTAELAEGYSIWLEAYAARLVKLAAELRNQFPATLATK